MKLIDPSNIRERMAVTNEAKFWPWFYGDSLYVFVKTGWRINFKRYQMSNGNGYRPVQYIKHLDFCSEIEMKYEFSNLWHPDFETFCKNIDVVPELGDLKNAHKLTPFVSNTKYYNKWNVFKDGIHYKIQFNNSYWYNPDLEKNYVVVSRMGSYVEREYDWKWSSALSRHNMNLADAQSYFKMLAMGQIEELLMEELL